MHDSRTLFIASDHAGFELKEYLKASYPNLKWHDLGPDHNSPIDYPDMADRVAQHLGHDPQAIGILICGSGQGMAMRANKYAHLRAALCWDEESARLAREHNDANVLCLGSRLIARPTLVEIFEIFLKTPFLEGRHSGRVSKINGKTTKLTNEVKMSLAQQDPQVSQIIDKELNRQKFGLELIASENYASRNVMEAQGSVLTNKYAEGYPGKRYYGGCQFVDEMEQLAIDRAKELFQAEYVNVQPHSGSQANMGAYLSVAQAGDTILGMDLSHGGHLTHGSPVNFSGILFKAFHYGVDPKSHVIDYDGLRQKAREVRPKILIAGFSAYPRELDYAAFRSIADEVGAYLVMDMAHIAGLVAGQVLKNPIPHCHFVTTTTHKTLRGPRGGMIFSKEEFAKKVNSKIFPGIQGGPLQHVIAAKAVALGEALKPEFKTYAAQVIKNAKALAETLKGEGFDLVTGGTDNHIVLLDLSRQNLTGKEAEEALERAAMTANKNTVPNEKLSPFVTSGIRLGTPALTTRGMKENEMKQIGQWIAAILRDIKNESLKEATRAQVRSLCEAFPIY